MSDEEVDQCFKGSCIANRACSVNPHHYFDRNLRRTSGLGDSDSSPSRFIFALLMRSWSIGLLLHPRGKHEPCRQHDPGGGVKTRTPVPSPDDSQDLWAEWSSKADRPGFRLAGTGPTGR